MIGLHGMPWANRAVQRADVILAVGMRFDDRVTGRPDTFAPHAKILHVELDHATWMCWSTMQGLVQLEGKFDAINVVRGRERVSTRELIDRFTDLIVRGLRPRPEA